MKRNKVVLIGIVGTIVVAGDLFVKRLAVTGFPSEASVPAGSVFALALHKNFGIAFDIPFKFPLVVIATAIIGSVLIHLAYKNRLDRPDRTAAALLILLGGLGNFIDRVFYGFTVDYLLILNRLAINLSDLLILGGVVWMLFGDEKHKQVDTSEKIA